MVQLNIASEFLSESRITNGRKSKQSENIGKKIRFGGEYFWPNFPLEFGRPNVLLRSTNLFVATNFNWTIYWQNYWLIRNMLYFPNKRPFVKQHTRLISAVGHCEFHGQKWNCDLQKKNPWNLTCIAGPDWITFCNQNW